MTVILNELPLACDECRRYLEQLTPFALHQINADQMAVALGFTNRGGLSNRLGKHGFPPLRVLRDWMLFLHAFEAWHHRGQPLQRWAWQNGIDPSVCYRAVRRAAGTEWEKAITQTLSYWLRCFQNAIGMKLCCHRIRRS